MKYSLRARILSGAVLWTAGLFLIAVVVLHFIFPPPSAHWLLQSVRQNQTLLVVFAILAMLAGLLRVRGGILPINNLRQRLAAVHSGISSRVDGSYPTEVQPLVDDLNALLEEREQRVKRAIAKAGDLAHGLKTPLAVLAYEAQQVRRAGHAELADEIEHQLDRMSRQIEYQLVHARASEPSAKMAENASVSESAQGLVRALRRAHAERELQVDIESAASHIFRGGRADLDEMLGNLLDNAFKWASSKVRLLSTQGGRTLTIAVDDDGFGIDPAIRGSVTDRGMRADEAGGSGLGLAIVHDLAEIHGGSISIGESPLGGVRALLTLPAYSTERKT